MIGERELEGVRGGRRERKKIKKYLKQRERELVRVRGVRERDSKRESWKERG